MQTTVPSPVLEKEKRKEEREGGEREEKRVEPWSII